MATMITEYHRPTSLQDALILLSRKDHITVPLGGGTLLSRFTSAPVEVVDLQLLHLNQIGKRGELLSFGATATLQALMDSSQTPAFLKESLLLEGTYNLRQIATVGGTLITAGGDSLFTALILACNAEIQWEPGSREVLFEKWLSEPKFEKHDKILVEIHFLSDSIVSFEIVSKTPRSKPEIFVAKAGQGTKVRYVLGGRCKLLHVFDGTIRGDSQKLGKFINNAYGDFLQPKATQPYFESTVTTLLKRLDVK